MDEGFGFALGWNYWYNWAVTIAVELVAAQLVMHYWFPNVPGVWWSAAFLGVMFLLNALTVRGFGEAEYWFALIKVVTVVAFIGVGLLMIFGILKGAPSNGWGNLTIGDAPFAGGLPALMGVAMIAGFVPGHRADRRRGRRIGKPAHDDPARGAPGVLADPAVLRVRDLRDRRADSLYRPEPAEDGRDRHRCGPFTLVFRHAGLAFAAGVMNAVILTAVLSAGNSGMYASTRMLYNLATEGRAPKIFAKLSAGGVPRNALYATTAVGALCFFTSLYGDKTVYLWLLNTSGMTGFIAWLGIAVSHYRFRKGYVKQGYALDQLPYQSKWFPFGPLFAFVLCLVIALGQDYQAFLANRIDWAGVAATYVGIPLFLVVWLGFRFLKKSRFVRYEDMEIAPWIAASRGAQRQPVANRETAG